MMVDKWVPNKHAFVKVNRIGSDSIWGEAYKVANYDDPKRPLFLAVKVVPESTDAANELDMYKRFSQVALKGISPHFPIILSTVKCDECRYDNLDMIENAMDHGESISKECRYVFNELAAGDLRLWSKTVHKPVEYYSMFAQILLGLGFMHSKGYSHNDAHWGNLLFHNVPAIGSWHYRINVTNGLAAGNITHDVYVKNTGQQWVWWDFGFMKKTYGNVNRDLINICHCCEWAATDLGVPYPEKVCKLIKQIGAATTMMTDIPKSDVLYLILGRFPTSAVVVQSAGKPAPKGVLNVQPFILTV